MGIKVRKPMPPETKAKIGAGVKARMAAKKSAAQATDIPQAAVLPLTIGQIITQLRTCWKCGEGWRLKFGRLLIQYHDAAEYGDWIKSLKSEFDLHRQTAWNWMKKAAEVDGILLQEEKTNNDEPDNFPEDIADGLDEHQSILDKIEKDRIKTVPISMIKVTGTKEEQDRYKAVVKKDREWVLKIQHDAFHTILAGKPPEYSEADDRPHKRLETLPDDAVENPIYFDQPEMPVAEEAEIMPAFYSGDNDVDSRNIIALPEILGGQPEPHNAA